MENWQPLKTIRNDGLASASPSVASGGGGAESPIGAIPAPPPAEGYVPAASNTTPTSQTQVFCTQCGRGPMSPGSYVALGNIRLCTQCDDDFKRHYQQQAASQSGPWATQAYAAVASGALVFASIFSRAIAKFVDNLIETVVLVIVMAATTDVSSLGFSLEDFAAGSEQVLITMRPYLLASIAFGVLYDTILVGKFSATLGKMALGIRVVSGEGTQVTWSQAAIRAIAPAILQLPGIFMPMTIWASIAQFIFLFGYVIAVMDPQRRTLYDHVANTRVVQ
jgi:uncharacterized RDD family membrane protein YckC